MLVVARLHPLYGDSDVHAGWCWRNVDWLDDHRCFPPHNYTTLANNLVNYTFSSGQTAPNDFALFQTHDPWGGTVVQMPITGDGHTSLCLRPHSWLDSHSAITG